MADPNSPNGPNGIYVLPFADIEHIANKHLDMAYASTSEFQKLDLYLPKVRLRSVDGRFWSSCMAEHG